MEVEEYLYILYIGAVPFSLFHYFVYTLFKVKRLLKSRVELKFFDNSSNFILFLKVR